MHSTRDRIRKVVATEQARIDRKIERGEPLLEASRPIDSVETMSLVCKYFCRGQTAVDICRTLKKRHGIKLTREKPYKLISQAAARGWLRFHAPLDRELTDRIEAKWGGLDGIEIVHTATFDDVAYRAANEIIRLLRQYKQGRRRQEEVHIGFAGGPAMRILARHLSDLMCRPQQGLPETVYLHALVSGFNPRDPTTDPNAFFTFFVRRAGMPLKVKFVGLHAPAVVSSENYRNLKGWVGVKEAYDVKDQIDLYVTSGAQWDDPHSLYRSCMGRSKPAIAKLEAAGCVGDVLWRPLGPRKPIDVTTTIRAMTLVELNELPEIINRDSHVMLMLGSCGGCDEPKGKLLKAVLNQEKPLITHLVTDSRTALQALGD